MKYEGIAVSAEYIEHNTNIIPGDHEIIGVEWDAGRRMIFFYYLNEEAQEVLECSEPYMPIRLELG